MKQHKPSHAIPVSDELRLNRRVSTREDNIGTARQLSAMLKWSQPDVESGRYRVQLYRFLSDHVPVISACIWTWARLAATGSYKVADTEESPQARQAQQRLDDLSDHLYQGPDSRPLSAATFLADLIFGLFRDGMYGGFVTIQSDKSAVDRFVPIDVADITHKPGPSGGTLYMERGDRRIDLDRPDFYFLPLHSTPTSPLGRSILRAVGFVTYIEQQLVDDMRRSSHNSGFHRLHVKVTPPERLSGESDKAFLDRINSYFDSTVDMIKTLEVADNPVTWDNVEIDYVGPSDRRTNANSWFFSHRAMIEEICAGTNLAPFMLGYSFGATSTWAGFKFDMVMRQIRSVQSEIARLLEWIGNIDLALGGFDHRCRFVFDNSFAYRADEESNIQSRRVESLLKLHDAGLIDTDSARRRAGELLLP